MTLNPKRGAFLFLRILQQNIKIRLEYKMDAFILLVSGGALQVLGFLFIAVLYSRIPAIAGWSMWEMVMMLSAIYFTEGVVSFAFEGLWNLNYLVIMGELDRILLRPVSPILQVCTFTMGMHGIGNMASAIVLFCVSMARADVTWTLGKILFMPVFVLSGAAIRAAISFAANCAAFWIKGFGNAFPLMIYQLADFAKYPTSIFGKGVQYFVTFIIPYAFISYLPAVYLFGKEPWGWTAWLSPIPVVACILFARWIFYRGLRKYEGAGN